MSEDIRIPNARIKLPDVLHDLAGKWISEDTAILVIHGIGDQNPLETIDQFGRALTETLRSACHLKLQVTQGLAKKEQTGGRAWFDNFIRIEALDDRSVPRGPHLDVYEYYWAQFTEDQMDLTDISSWVGKVTSGARRFYKDDMRLGIRAGDKSFFFRNGKFIYWKYMFFVYWVCAFIPSIGFFSTYALRWLSHIPVIGIVFRWIYAWFMKTGMRHLTNIIGDITVYNTTDEKSKFYRVRQEILSGSVEALCYLIEPDEAKKPRYGKVVLAGHSLGTQIAYDSVNRLLHLVHEGEVKGYRGDGTTDEGKHLRNVLSGFVTFGSPLDKIAFFLREQVPHEQYIREQILLNFHCFKQRDWNTSLNPYPLTIKPIFARLLDDMKWRNYFDRHDYVSGSLDYYEKLTNVDCRFKGNVFSFTHSDYWRDRRMFEDIVAEFLV